MHCDNFIGQPIYTIHIESQHHYSIIIINVLCQFHKVIVAFFAGPLGTYTEQYFFPGEIIFRVDMVYRSEAIQVNSVGYTNQIVVTQHRLLHQLLQPLRHGDYCEIFNFIEIVTLVGIVFSRSVEPDASRINPFQRASKTARFPSIAICRSEMGAMSGKCPAIMQSPHHRFPCLTQIIEEYGIIEIIAVNIVKMYHIGVNLFYLLD